MIRLGVLISGLALLATFDIGEGVCMSCSDKCKAINGPETLTKFVINDPEKPGAPTSVDCVCKVGTNETRADCPPGTLQSDGKKVEFCCSPCNADEICPTSVDEEDKCETEDDCTKDAGDECGYDCMDGKCAMWCNMGEPEPEEDKCETEDDCPKDAGTECGYDCMDGKCAMWCNMEEPVPLSCVTSEDCTGEEQCHCEAPGKVRRRLLFASVMMKCSCRV